MPGLSFLRPFFVLLSLVLLGGAAYLLWDWYRGDVFVDADGVLRRTRHAWELWTGGALLAWSFLGRYAMLLLLARRDDDPTRMLRADGEVLTGADGAKLHVESYGPVGAPAIILTHGWSLDSTIWFYAKRDLARSFRIIVWDLPGLGRSSTGSHNEVSLSNYAKDLQTVLAYAGSPAVLVGHSIGGMIIETFARDDPQAFVRDVSGAVLVNTTYTNPLETIIFSGLLKALRWPVIEPMMRLRIWLQPLSWVSAWQSYLSGSTHLFARLAFGRYVTRSQLDQTALLATRNPPAITAKGDLAMFRWDCGDALSKMRVPVLVIGGSKDIVTKPAASQTIAARVPNASLQVVDGVNHMGFLERAGTYNGLIAEFAGSIQRAQGENAASKGAFFAGQDGSEGTGVNASGRSATPADPVRESPGPLR